MSKYPGGQSQLGGFILFSEQIIHPSGSHVLHSGGHENIKRV